MKLHSQIIIEKMRSSRRANMCRSIHRKNGAFRPLTCERHISLGYGYRMQKVKEMPAEIPMNPASLSGPTKGNRAATVLRFAAKYGCGNCVSRLGLGHPTPVAGSAKEVMRSKSTARREMALASLDTTLVKSGHLPSVQRDLQRKASLLGLEKPQEKVPSFPLTDLLDYEFADLTRIWLAIAILRSSRL